MQLGIRPKLLLALGSVLLVAFVPLFFAVANLSRASMITVRESTARALGRAIAGHVEAARERRADVELQPLLDAQVGQEGVSAVGAYDIGGALVAHAGERATLPANVTPGAEHHGAAQTSQGGALVVVVPGPKGGAVAVVVRTDSSTVPASPLAKLFALYIGIVFLGLLFLSYLAMTRLVVRPLDEMAQRAGKVADGARRFEPPRGGGREIAELGESLASMTSRLRADEEELRKRVAEIEQSARELEQAQNRLVRSERLASVGRLSAGLAHEIGNPIAAILGFQDLLLSGGLEPAEQRDFLERMKRETERIHKVLRDLLDFARPAAQPAEGENAESPGSVTEAVLDVMALVRPQKAFRDVTVEADVAPDLPLVKLGHSRLLQVLLNLLMNAADALGTIDGRVVVRAARNGNDGVHIEVEDNGRGIAKDVEDRIVEPFVTTKEVGKGTGLGLAVCRGLVEGASGTIGLAKGSLGGARFVIDLPAAPSP